MDNLAVTHGQPGGDAKTAFHCYLTEAVLPKLLTRDEAEVAAMVLWLCNPGASFVIGHALAVDGGYTAR